MNKRITEHKQVVERFDDKIGITVHIRKHDHQINWDGASIVAQEQFYWQRRVRESISIQSQNNAMNLGCGLKLSNSWLYHPNY